MFKNGSGQSIALFAFTTTDGVPKAGDAANITAYVSKDFGAVTALADTSATEMDATNAKGWYLFAVAQAESNADALLFTGKSATANVSVVGVLIYTLPTAFTAHVAQTGDSFAIVNSGAFGNSALKTLVDTLDNLVDTGVSDIQARIPAALVGGRMDASVGAMAANTLTAAATAADFATEIQVGLATAADLAIAITYIDTEVAAVKAVTDLLTLTAIADAILDRDMATGTDSGSPTVRTVRQALRALRNKSASAAGTLTVYKEDDATASWTAVLTTDAAAVPIITIDPAGP